MLLGLDTLARLVQDPEVQLVENLGPRDVHNPEGAGYDLRVGAIFKLKANEGFLGVDERETPEASPLAHVDSDPNATVTLPGNSYFLLQTIETLHIPDTCVGLVQPRSTLFRSGLILSYSQVNPGYSGQLTFGLLNATQTSFRLQLGARVAHLMVAAVEGATGAYRGQWQGGRVWSPREHQK